MATFNLYKTLENDLNVDTENRTVSVIPQLEKKDYSKVKLIINRLGGRWVKQTQCFLFDKCPQVLLDRVLSLGSRRLNKFHFYPSTDEIFNYMVEFTPLSYLGASDNRVVNVLEPSAGEGGLIKKLLDFGESEGRNFNVTGYDIDPLNVIYCQEAGLNVHQADFLSIEPVQEYELAILNPPFNRFEFIDHIKHAQKFLTKDGVLISVVPTNWIKKAGLNTNCAWLLEQAQIDSTSDLLENNFFEPGTFDGVSIHTAIICLRSCERAERALNKDEYRFSSIDAFRLYIDNEPNILNRLERLQESDKNKDEVLHVIDTIVSNILHSVDNETVHLVRRFEEDYKQALIEDWFPEFVAPPEPQQLDMGFFFEENKDAA